MDGRVDLRLRFELGLGQRQIARSCGTGLGTVHDYLERAAAAGIGWPLPEGWNEEEDKIFFGGGYKSFSIPSRCALTLSRRMRMFLIAKT